MEETAKNGRIHLKSAKGFSFVLALLIACVAAFILLWAVFGLWSYGHQSSVAYPYRSHYNDDAGVVLSGKDGLFFASLPAQQIQLIESISPIRTLDAKIALVLKSPADKNEIVAKLPLIQDTILSYLRTTTLNELQETGRLFVIKEALLDQINTLIFPTQIQDVLFQKMIVKEAS